MLCFRESIAPSSPVALFVHIQVTLHFKVRQVKDDLDPLLIGLSPEHGLTLEIVEEVDNHAGIKF